MRSRTSAKASRAIPSRAECSTARLPSLGQTGVDAIVDTMGPPDILVNVAGGFTWEMIADGTVES